MGKIFKKPKMPTLPPLPAYTPPEPTPTETTDNEPTPDEQRVANILSRKRGRLGTIATSFNGILQNGNDLSLTRKTLLGE